MARGDGRLFLRGDMIWAQATINGRLHRLSTGKRLSSLTKKWFENTSGVDAIKSILEKKEENALSYRDISLKKFGMEVIVETSQNRGYASQKDAVRILNNHILPFFKNMAIAEIRPMDIVKFINHFKNKFSEARAKRIKHIFGLIMTYAYDNKLIENNPMLAQSVARIKFNTKPEDDRVYTSNEVNLMLSKSYGWLKVYLEVAFTTGLRVGEVMGLKWEDIDLESGYLFLSRSISKGTISEGSNGDKNHERPIPLFPRTLNILKSYYDVRPSNEWLFINKDKGPFLEAKTIVDYHFKPFLESIGVEYKTLMAIRRTYASLMNFGGKNKDEIRRVMGHSKTSTTMERHYVKQGVLTHQNYTDMAQSSEVVFNQMIGA